MKKYLLTAMIEADDDSDLKKLSHHIEYLFDLDNWPEIKSVSEVEVTEVVDYNTF